MFLEGKTALVTGGSRGIGRAIALGLASEGADVAVTYFRNRQDAEQTAAAIRNQGRRTLLFRTNLADGKDIEKLFEEIQAAWGGLDIFVSNAVSATLRPVLELESRHWDRPGDRGGISRQKHQRQRCLSGPRGLPCVAGVCQHGAGCERLQAATRGTDTGQTYWNARRCGSSGCVSVQ